MAVMATLIALSVLELLVTRLAAFLDADLRLAYFGSGDIAAEVAALVAAAAGTPGQEEPS